MYRHIKSSVVGHWVFVGTCLFLRVDHGLYRRTEISSIVNTLIAVSGLSEFKSDKRLGSSSTNFDTSCLSSIRTMDEREVTLIKRMKKVLNLPVTHIAKVARRSKSTIEHFICYA